MAKGYYAAITVVIIALIIVLSVGVYAFLDSGIVGSTDAKSESDDSVFQKENENLRKEVLRLNEELNVLKYEALIVSQTQTEKSADILVIDNRRVCDRLEEDEEELEDDIDDLEKEIDDLKDLIEEKEANNEDVSDLEDELDELKEELEDLEDDLEDIEDDLDDENC